MPLHGDPFGHEPVRETRKVRVGDIGEERRLVRDGMQVMARGSMICPECTLPISPPPRIRPKAELRCGFCDHLAPAHAFVRDGTFDTFANEVLVVARVV